MDSAPLVMDEIDAGAEFIKRLAASYRVAGACWMRSAEDGERYLYVAIDGLSDANSDAAYLEVLKVTRGMTDHYLDPFRVKLIGTADPIAKAMQDIYRRYPGRIPTRFNGAVFGDIAVAEVYVYPKLPAMP